MQDCLDEDNGTMALCEHPVQFSVGMHDEDWWDGRTSTKLA